MTIKPIALSSANGLEACRRAVDRSLEGADPLDAVVEGVMLVEDDPEDYSVGYGGLPNEQGEVELDAAVMHGPTHSAGAVAGVRGIRHVSKLAQEVARRTDHSLLVGEGASEFARSLGMKEEDLLTDFAREAFEKWKGGHERSDDWLSEDEFDLPSRRRDDTPRTTGTVHVSLLDSQGDLASCTSTSGLSWSLPGRVGDSPLVGCGLYTDNEIGSAGCTGRGESTMVIAAAHEVVMRLESGDEPNIATRRVLERLVRKAPKRLMGEDGRPDFNVTIYALRKDGAHGSCAIAEGKMYAVATPQRTWHEPCAALYEGLEDRATAKSGVGNR
ncbi:MAG: N(4)-(beta-N-acetylglucosaminyl)-L-asparaginase [Planctomycetota bacterium]